jgi:hypothetical protein
VFKAMDITGSIDTVLEAEMNHCEGGFPEDEWSRERPDFGPKQIRSEDEIQFSMRLRECSLVPDCPTGTLTVTSKAPYRSMDGLYIDVAYDNRTEGIINLMDFSVVPTHKGRWNPSHWLEGSNE